MSRLKVPIVRFNGDEWLFLVGDDGSGPLTTEARYQAGEMSYAHVMADGRIMRFHAQIGHREQLQYVNVAEHEPTPDDPVAWFTKLLSWERP